MSKDAPVQRITLAGSNYVLLCEEEYHALAAAAKALSTKLNRPVSAAQTLREEADFLSDESKLRAWRKFRGLSQKELAQTVGVVTSHVAQIESGARLGKPALWRALANALGVTVDDILPEE